METIGVVSGNFTPKIEILVPSKGKGAGAGRGAGIGASRTVEVGGLFLGGGLLSGHPFGALIGVGFFLGSIALAPVGAIVGAVGGAVIAESASNIEEAEAILYKVLEEVNVQEAIQDRIIDEAADNTRFTFVLLREGGPNSFGEEVSYASLTGREIDAILEVSVPTFGVKGEGGVNPPLFFEMVTNVRFIQGPDKMLYKRSFVYQSQQSLFLNWAADDGKLFRDEIDHGYRFLSEKIVEELFLVYLPGLSRKPVK
ncbi:MAG: hypothetical protein ACE5FY_06685 [Nitrospiria bacterium]